MGKKVRAPRKRYEVPCKVPNCPWVFVVKTPRDELALVMFPQECDHHGKVPRTALSPGKEGA